MRREGEIKTNSLDTLPHPPEASVNSPTPFIICCPGARAGLGRYLFPSNWSWATRGKQAPVHLAFLLGLASTRPTDPGWSRGSCSFVLSKYRRQRWGHSQESGRALGPGIQHWVLGLWDLAAVLWQGCGC
jgi:hypothetical protein